MKQPHTLKSLFEILLVIGAILLISLFFAIRSQAQPGADATPTDVVLWPSPSPVGAAAQSVASPTAIAPTAVARGQQPPACTFPLAQIKGAKSKPETYSFSEPQVVRTAEQGNSFDIVEWLPNNQQVLITEELRNRADKIETIELYNPETGESEVYAMRPITHEPPLWQPQLNAVVYPVMKYFDVDPKARTYNFTRQIWVSRGDPKAAQMLADNLPQLPLAVKPGGGEMLYLSGQKLSKKDQSLRDTPSVSFDPAQWDYATGRRNTIPVSYKMAWQPDTSLVFLYSEGVTGGGGYTFILNADTGQVCELGLGGWASGARWSSDGRYLAFIRSTRYAFPTYSADLTVLDTVTGKPTVLIVIPQEVEGAHYVDDFVWAPDNRHLLALGSISKNKQSDTGLYLVDFVTGQGIHIMPEKKNFLFSYNNNLAWSPDGSKVAIHCLAQRIDQICLISVKQTTP